MITLKSLKEIKKKEQNSRTILSKLPDNFYNDCAEALEQLFKDGDYDRFKEFQNTMVRLHEQRIGKLLNSIMYRSVSSLGNNVPNLTEDETVLFNSLIDCIHKNVDDVDLLVNGYYLQKVR